MTNAQKSIFDKQLGQSIADGNISTLGDAAKFGADWVEYAMKIEIERLQAENETLRHNLNVFSVEHGRLQEDIKKMHAENELLKAYATQQGEIAEEYSQGVAQMQAENIRLRTENARFSAAMGNALREIGGANYAVALGTLKNTLEK